MRKLTMATLISVSTLSFTAAAAFANGPQMERCNAGPPLGAEERSAAAAPQSPQVPGVNLGCLDGTDRSAYYDRSFRRSSRDRNYDRDARRFDRDDRGYNTSRSNSAPDTVNQ